MVDISSITSPAEDSAKAIEQLTSVFQVYNEATDRMHHAYEKLQGEVVRLRRELEQKNEQLQRKNRLAALGEMAAGIAHEIRNPLAGVQLYASLLERDLQGYDDRLHWVHKISKGVGTLDQIVNDMLAFTQDQPSSKTPINLVGLLAEATDYIKPQVHSTEVRVCFKDIDKNFMFKGDVNMMRRIFINLILNAVDAVGALGQITLQAEHVGKNHTHQTRIRVSDTGCGIKPEVLDKIFNPFFTTKDSGIGLGLAIVHRLIESQGGVITAANNDDGGATFTIGLP